LTKRVLTLALKDLRLLLRDKLGLFFIVVIPVVFGVFFGLINASFADGDGGGAVMDVGIVDLDASDMSHRFVESLNDLESVQVKPSDGAQAAHLVRQGKLLGFVTIPRGFGETAGIFWVESTPLQLSIDPGRKAEAGMLKGLIMQAMGELMQARFANPAGMRGQIKRTLAEIDADAASQPALRQFMGSLDTFFGSLDAFTASMSPDRRGAGPKMELAKIETVEITAPPGEHEALTSKLRSPWDISFPSAIMWGIMGSVAGFAISIVKERSEGTFLRLKISPVTRAQILAGKGLGCFLTTLGVIAMMMVLGLILGIQLHSFALLVLAALSTAVCFVGLMMLMSVIGRTEQAVAGAGWAIIIVMCMFGGGMVPLAFMPGFMKTLSHFSPVKWGVLALEGAIWRGFSLTEMLAPCGILIAIGLLGFVVGARRLAHTD